MRNGERERERAMHAAVLVIFMYEEIAKIAGFARPRANLYGGERLFDTMDRPDDEVDKLQFFLSL